MALINKIAIALTILIIVISCNKNASKETVLLDFESDAALDQLYWNCHTLYSLSAEHVTHGSKSLKLDLFPSDYPGLAFTPTVTDWRGYKQIGFDVYNPSQNPVEITVRIDDKIDYPGSDDWYNKAIILHEGNNHVAIPLDTLVVTQTNRHLDLTHIYSMLIFSVQPKVELTLYIDAVKLINK